MVAGTAQGKLLMFTPEFDVLYEVPIDDGDMTFVDAAADDENKDKVRDAEISWRGDSQIFVVNYGISTGRKCLTRDV